MRFKNIYPMAVGILLLVMGMLLPNQVRAAESDFTIKDGVLTKYTGTEKEVTVPDTVIKISKDAFYSNQELVTVIIPDSVTEIGNTAFGNCKNLKSVTLPESIHTIGNGAFWNCVSLIDINIPKSAINIGKEAFALTPWLDVKRAENPLVIINGTLIDGTKATGRVTLPKSVKTISGSAFIMNKNITAITIPDSVTSIGDGAFYSCLKLETVVMADSVTSIGSDIFRLCKGLKNITLSKSLVTIPDFAFAGCSSLTAITIPGQVATIGSSAFSSCKNLKSVTAADKVKKINSGVFNGKNKSLTLYGFEGSYLQKYAKANKISFKKLALNTSKSTLSKGKTVTLKLNSLSECTWKASNTTVASVDKNGKVTAKKKGTVTITASRYGKTFKCTVTVK